VWYLFETMKWDPLFSLSSREAAVRCHYSTTTTLMSVVPSWAQARVRRNVNMMLTLRRTLDCVACVPVSR